MRPEQNFVTWQPVLTDHQAYTYQELSRVSGRPLVAYVSRKEDATRQKQGWKETSVTSIERRLIPQSWGLAFIVRALLQTRKDIHFFASPFEEPRMILAMTVAARLGIDFYLISEPYSPVSVDYFEDSVRMAVMLKTRLRPLVYRAYAAWLRAELSGIFAISPLAVAQYERAGVPRRKLYPFGYFVPRADQLRTEARALQWEEGSFTGLRLVFVGSLIKRKGLDVLIDAVRQARAFGADLRLDVYGPGNPGTFCFDGSAVRYCGAIVFGTAQQVIASYDALVLPSHYDGWGVVVNEAICAGVPVLCSDAVGAGVLVETFGIGARFAATDTAGLARELVALAEDRTKLRVMRSRCHAAAESIQPVEAARYMYTILRERDGRRDEVPSPWYSQE